MHFHLAGSRSTTTDQKCHHISFGIHFHLTANVPLVLLVGTLNIARKHPIIAATLADKDTHETITLIFHIIISIAEYNSVPPSVHIHCHGGWICGFPLDRLGRHVFVLVGIVIVNYDSVEDGSCLSIVRRRTVKIIVGNREDISIVRNLCFVHVKFHCSVPISFVPFFVLHVPADLSVIIIAASITTTRKFLIHANVPSAARGSLPPPQRASDDVGRIGSEMEDGAESIAAVSAWEVVSVDGVRSFDVCGCSFRGHDVE
mmetsp:Transcript_21374/g.42712  ORF Transcript_21374/g.42712 Transcript_21374/m.42712 type:complete len:259 (+) Transcript_21374:1181-1957(+)